MEPVNTLATVCKSKPMVRALKGCVLAASLLINHPAMGAAVQVEHPSKFESLNDDLKQIAKGANRVEAYVATLGEKSRLNVDEHLSFSPSGEEFSQNRCAARCSIRGLRAGGVASQDAEPTRNSLAFVNTFDEVNRVGGSGFKP